ncbi:MAG: hypothetical protein K0R15_649 [Clostridiales bacterium]|jgi:uncharacterized protein (DUF1015 family)|nr:hypothetical protein [Clostridiales bacterium]
MEKVLLKEAKTNEVQVATINLTVVDLIDEIEMLKWREGIEVFRITENFKINGKKEFKVENFQMELEDGIVACGDADDTIIENGSVLIGFLETSLLHIKKRNKCYELLFSDGQIVIHW